MVANFDERSPNFGLPSRDVNGMDNFYSEFVFVYVFKDMVSNYKNPYG